ncbi:MAG: glycosyltransferase [Proteobacteria bacterium]|nr:glycosyltransferase [Pseudomonadota bacterium]
MMASNPFPENSKDYWEFRFTNDWETQHGPAQTRFFVQLALNSFPAWLTSYLETTQASFCDWGCAQGDGTALLAERFPGHAVCGVDFSAAAIETARVRHPGVHFDTVNLLEQPAVEPFAVLFSSNTLEHFARPFEVLNTLAASAHRVIILLIPFEEFERFHEHEATFEPGNIPLFLDNGFSLVHRASFDTRRPPTSWDGKQILLVYARPDAQLRQLVLADAGPTDARLGELAAMVVPGPNGPAREEALAQPAELERTRDRLAELERYVLDKERYIAALNDELLVPRSQRLQLERAVAEHAVYVLDKERHIANLTREVEALRKERLKLRSMVGVRASVKLGRVIRKVRATVDLTRTSYEQEGARGVLRAWTTRRAQAPTSATDATTHSWPYESIELLKDIEVEAIDRSFAFETKHAPFAVVTTVKNEERRIETFLADITKQTVLPEELVIVDGGSTDGTRDIIRRWAAENAGWVRFEEGESINIARGRNLGVGLTTRPVIVFIDAGCRLDPGVFANLYGPFAESNPDLVGGIYHAVTDTEHAQHFLSNWNEVVWKEFLPSARCLAVRRDRFVQVGGFPEYLTLTGEDTLFDIEYRRVSERWVFNRKAQVLWDAPTTATAAQRLAISYTRGDGESGIGDFAFRLGEQPDPSSIRAKQLEGYREGRTRRARIEVERRGVRSVVLLFSGVSFTDIGGGQRATQLALELVRRGHKVVFVHQYPRYGDQVHKLFFDIDYTLLELYFHTDFDVAEFAARYAPLEVAVTVITEFPHPHFQQQVELLKTQLPRAKYVFDYIDLWDSSLGGDWFDPKVEREMLARADVLVASARTLKENLEGKASREVHMLANAVNTRLFQGTHAYPRPRELSSLRPYVLYVGSLYGEWFDWKAMEAAARELPDMDLVFIGDDKGVEQAAALARAFPTVIFLGPKPQRELPAYLHHAHVCIIPFRADCAITKYVNPLKVYEYLAMGRPVVASGMDDLIDMPGVTLSESSEDFGRAIRAAIAAPFNTAEVAGFIERNSWIARVTALEALLGVTTTHA